MIVRSPRVRPGKFVLVDAKRLLQQYRTEADIGYDVRPCQNRSFHLLQQLPRVTQQGLNLPALGDRVLGEQAVLARVLVSPWRAGTRRTAVHAAAPFAARRRRAA